ncbi:MAG: hypothetical protein ABSH36_00600 [Solirubrobacteraceae bacterium]
MSPPKCFLHVPKSGGSSVHAALELALAPGSLAPRRFDSAFSGTAADVARLRQEARDLIAFEPHEVRELGGYRAVSGHFALDTLLQITDAASVATVLREPRARLLSLYLYWRVPGIGDSWAPHKTPEHAHRPLREFLAEPKLAPMIDNQVCRILLHGDTRLRAPGFVDPADVETLAADAIERLDELGFVGVLELGEAVWDGLGGMFDVTLKPNAVNAIEDHGALIPIGPNERLMTAEALELLERRNAADLLVYDHALARAGLDVRERRLLADGAFASQLVKLGDLIGRSAAQAAERVEQVEALRGEAEGERGRWQAAVAQHEQEVQECQGRIRDLEADVARHEETVERLQRWLAAVHASASWKLTTPLRAAKRVAGRVQPALRTDSSESLLGGLSVNQVWWFALALCAVIAATDAILSHVVLIMVLTVGPLCGALTGRWMRTASVGVWALMLAVPLGLADSVWDTLTQLVDVGTITVVALLSTLAATLIERHAPRVG